MGRRKPERKARRGKEGRIPASEHEENYYFKLKISFLLSRSSSGNLTGILSVMTDATQR